MPVGADARDQEIDSAGAADGGLVLRAESVVGLAGQEVNVLRQDVDRRKKVLPEIVIEAAHIRRWHADVFVEIENPGAGEVEIPLAIHSGEFAIEAKWRAACRQRKYGAWIG